MSKTRQFRFKHKHLPLKFYENAVIAYKKISLMLWASLNYWLTDKKIIKKKQERREKECWTTFKLANREMLDEWNKIQNEWSIKYSARVIEWKVRQTGNQAVCRGDWLW